MTRTKNNYITAKAELDGKLSEYFAAAAEIEEQYEKQFGAQATIEDEALIERIFEDQEAVRSDMGIFALEMRCKAAEEELIESFRSKLEENETEIAAKYIGVPIETMQETFTEAERHFKFRQKLIEIALRF